MSVRTLLLAGALVAGVPAFADSPNAQGARNAVNWEVFEKLYPAKALAAREEGAVGFIVTIDKAGDVTDCHPIAAATPCSMKKRARS